MKTVLAAATLAAMLVGGSSLAVKADTTLPFGLISEGGGSFTYTFTFTPPTGEYLIGISASSSTKSLKFTGVSFLGFSDTFSPSVSSFGEFPTVFVPGGPQIVTITGTGPGKFNGNVTVSAVPLPTSVALFGTAVMGLGVAGALRRKGGKSLASTSATA